jgi:hypothetical protein
VTKVVGILVLAVFVLGGWTLYANVFANDAELRIKAENIARDATGCRSCARLRFEGASSILGKTYTFTFDKTGSIAIGCRRPYIAFGEFQCAPK